MMTREEARHHACKQAAKNALRKYPNDRAAQVEYFHRERRRLYLQLVPPRPVFAKGMEYVR